MYKVEICEGSPFSSVPPDFTTLKARLEAANKTLQFLGNDVVVDEDDQAKARDLISNPDVPIKPDDLQDAGCIVHLRHLISEYDKQVIYNAASLRNYVTNRLLEESSTAPKATERIKALELLGKIGDVGLFTERSEVTIRQRPTEEIERLLKEKLLKVIDADPVTPVLVNTSVQDVPAA